MFCYSLLYVHSSIAIILMGKRELVALLGLSSWCLVMVERLFLAVPWGCLWFVVILTYYYKWLSPPWKKHAVTTGWFWSHVKLCDICWVGTGSMFQIISLNYTYWAGSHTLTFERQNGWAYIFFKIIVDYSGLYIFIVHFADGLNFNYNYRIWPWLIE